VYESQELRQLRPICCRRLLNDAEKDLLWLFTKFGSNVIVVAICF